MFLNLVNQDNLNFGKYLQNLIELLTNQSANQLLNCRNKLKISTKLSKTLFIAFICVWIQSASILTKAFTGVLLESYFSVKSVPIVNDLMDVHNNPELRVNAIMSYLSIIDKYHEYYSLEHSTTQSLIVRGEAFQKETRFEITADLFDRSIFEQIVQGRMILIINSLSVESYRDNFKMWKDMFTIAETSYLPSYLIYAVNKKMFLAEKAKYL